MPTDVGGLGSAETGVAVSRAGGKAFFQPVTPRALERLDEDQAHVLRHLQSISIQMRRLEAEIDDAVMLCRDADVSWALIGWSLDTTGEAARQRWGVGRGGGR